MQAEQATGAKVQAAVSIGATVFGALLGRKAVSAEHARAARRRPRGVPAAFGKESQDVARAETNVGRDARQQRDELDAALQADLQAVSAQFDASQDTLERVLVKPKRGGVSVQLVALVWVSRS